MQDGSGSVLWNAAPYIDDQDNFRFSDERCLGLRADPNRFFRVRMLPDDNLRELARQVFEGVVTELDREFLETDFSLSTEVTDWYGKSLDRRLDRKPPTY